MREVDLPLFESPRRVRRGIAIAGGGAKGAYSFGCLKALADAGITFEAVSATSAGALNGAILSTGALEAGEALWLKMAPENTYELRGALKWLPSSLSRSLLLALVLAKLYVGRFAYGITIPAFDRFAGLLVGVTTAAVATWIIFHLDYSTEVRIVIGLCAANVIGMLSVGIAKNNTSMTVFACLLLMISPAYLLLDKVYPPILNAINHRIDAMDNAILAGAARIVWLVGNIVLSIGTLIAVPVLVFLALRWLEGLFGRVVVFSSEPLRTTIREFINCRDIALPFFATVAQSQWLVDPDNFKWTNTAINPDPAADVEYGRWSPDPVACWMPTYVRIDQLTPEHRLDALVATAALPFGIVPSVLIDGKNYVDGGLADNDPVAPLLTMELDEIWLLSLDHESMTPEEHLLRAARLLRLFEVRDRPVPETVVGKSPPRVANEPPLVVPIMSLDGLPELVVVKPNQSLGGLFDGTLNFTPTYAKALIDQGYAETSDFLCSR